MDSYMVFYIWCSNYIYLYFLMAYVYYIPIIINKDLYQTQEGKKKKTRQFWKTLRF